MEWHSIISAGKKIVPQAFTHIATARWNSQMSGAQAFHVGGGGFDDPGASQTNDFKMYTCRCLAWCSTLLGQS